MRANKKEALLAAAQELFGELGYADTTFKKISERAGVALGLLAHHYGSKEKLFLACGMNVLEKFRARLEKAVVEAETGYAGVMMFCKTYLDFSLEPQSNWLVLVRCSPYSDMKTKKDSDVMNNGFEEIHQILYFQLERGAQDGSLFCDDVRATTQVIISLLVGVNRTRFLTPYAVADLYESSLEFVARAIKA